MQKFAKFSDKVQRILISGWNFAEKDSRTEKWGCSFADEALQMKIKDDKFGVDYWPLWCRSVRLSDLCGVDWCGFLFQAGAPSRVLCHTLQAGQ